MWTGKWQRWIPAVALAVLAMLAACNLPQQPSVVRTPVPVPGAVKTSVSATLTAAAPTAQATAASPGVTPAPGVSASPPSGQPTSTPAASATPTLAAGMGRVEGLVWQDECTLTPGEDGGMPTPAPNCRQYPTLGYAGDGQRQPEESGIAGVRVELATGTCPGVAYRDAKTDGEGHFVFDGVKPGVYCLRVDPNTPPNDTALPLGDWTSPQVSNGALQVTVAAGQVITTRFGWYAFPQQGAGACENRMTFLSENYPDGSQVPPGEAFTKQWTVRNTGTCVWTPEYRLVYVGGNLPGKVDSVTLERNVPPGGETTFEVPFVAPNATGSYESDWRLEDGYGEKFGPGAHGEGKLWLKIAVPETTANLNLGAPTVADPMNSATRWYLLNLPEARFEMGGGRLVMHGMNPGMVDTWALSSYPALGDAYIEATFVTGGSCAGQDRYGMIVRAPDTNQGIVVEFACNGRYRIYIWDGAHYTALQHWTSAAAIHTGPNKTNKMGVWLEGGTLKLYANRMLLATVQQSHYLSPGKFGLVIAADQTLDFTVAVDEVDYWSPLP